MLTCCILSSNDFVEAICLHDFPSLLGQLHIVLFIIVQLRYNIVFN
jgi:hypothetical protein